MTNINPSFPIITKIKNLGQNPFISYPYLLGLSVIKELGLYSFRFSQIINSMLFVTLATDYQNNMLWLRRKLVFNKHVQVPMFDC